MVCGDYKWGVCSTTAIYMWYFVGYNRLQTNKGNIMTVPIKQPEFRLLNIETGEEIPFDTLVSSDKPDRWDKVYTKNLARMLDVIGDEKIKVVAYLLKKKDNFNQITATMREISAATGVSLKTVSRVMKTMQEHDYLHKIRNGRWRLSPRIICGGKTSIAMATINYYDNTDKK